MAVQRDQIDREWSLDQFDILYTCVCVRICPSAMNTGLNEMPTFVDI